MHEQICLPCVFGCNSLPLSTITSQIGFRSSEETAHYLCCPILLGILIDTYRREFIPSLHDLVYGKGTADLNGPLVCATGYHVYHSLKLGNKVILQKAIDSGNFALVPAHAHSTTKAFQIEFGIQSIGGILKCGCHHSSTRQTVSDLRRAPAPTSSLGPAASASHSLPGCSQPKLEIFCCCQDAQQKK